jgi:uncharacterized iron-regulated membrane protein
MTSPRARPGRLVACTVCGMPTMGAYCALHARGPSTTQRGYGRAHQQRRKALLAAAYGRACPLCGETMLVGQALDLHHSTPIALERRMGHRSSSGDQIVHASCNRSHR